MTDVFTPGMLVRCVDATGTRHLREGETYRIAAIDQLGGLQFPHNDPSHWGYDPSRFVKVERQS